MHFHIFLYLSIGFCRLLRVLCSVSACFSFVVLKPLLPLFHCFELRCKSVTELSSDEREEGRKEWRAGDGHYSWTNTQHRIANMRGNELAYAILLLYICERWSPNAAVVVAAALSALASVRFEEYTGAQFAFIFESQTQLFISLSILFNQFNYLPLMYSVVVAVAAAEQAEQIKFDDPH